MTRLDQLRKIIETKTAATIEDVFIDVFTAQAIIEVWENLTPVRKEQFMNMTMKTTALLSHKLLAKFGN